LSPFKAANATFALNAGLWFRLGRLAIFAPSSRHAAGSGAENPPNSTVQISRATSDNNHRPAPLDEHLSATKSAKLGALDIDLDEISVYIGQQIIEGWDTHLDRDDISILILYK
jgi:hypothetical protein